MSAYGIECIQRLYVLVQRFLELESEAIELVEKQAYEHAAKLLQETLDSF